MERAVRASHFASLRFLRCKWHHGTHVSLRLTQSGTPCLARGKELLSASCPLHSGHRGHRHTVGEEKVRRRRQEGTGAVCFNCCSLAENETATDRVAVERRSRDPGSRGVQHPGCLLEKSGELAVSATTRWTVEDQKARSYF